MGPHNLPRQPTRLVGRRNDIDLARQRLLDPNVRLLTLSGPGGVGKTRLALAVAATVLDEFCDGAFFVDLATVTDPDLVVAAISAVLGVVDGDDYSLDDRLRRLLREKRTLLILDNFEQVVDAAPVLVDLLAGTSFLKLLVTSRSVLRVGWEHEFPVPPLALPDPAAGSHLEAAKASPAVMLFVDRARAVKPDFRIDARNAGTITAICSRLDGLPLAIELAAARIKLLAPRTMLSWLERAAGRSPFQLLTTGRKDLPPRHLALWTEIDWSYRLLDPDEQAFFRRLAVFVGDVSLEAAEVIRGEEPGAGLGISEARSTLELLESLVDKSLLFRRIPATPDNGSGRHAEAAEERSAPRLDDSDARSELVFRDETRFAMLQTIREFALVQLATRGELEATRRRHAMLFVDLAARAEREIAGVEQATALDRLEREHDNLRAALAWSLENDSTTAVRLAGHLWRFWEIRGHFREGRRWLEAALDRAGDAGMELRAKAWMGLGTMAWRQTDYVAAATFHAKSLALYQNLGDWHGVARALNNLGAQAQNLRDLDRARSLLEQSLTVAREVGDADVSIMSLVNLAMIAMDRRDYVSARSRLEQALDLSREVRNARYTAVILEDLGETLHHQGDLRGALARLGESLQLAWSLAASSDVAFGLEEIAGVFADLGHDVKAARLFGAAEAIRDAINSPVPPTHRAQYYDRQVASLRKCLGIDAFASAWADGRRLAPRQAVEYALEAAAMDGPSGGAGEEASRSSRMAGLLTHREREVATLIAHGRTNREIAERLLITEGTAANHVLHILNKLGFRSRSEIAAWAVAHGLRDDLVPRSVRTG